MNKYISSIIYTIIGIVSIGVFIFVSTIIYVLASQNISIEYMRNSDMSAYSDYSKDITIGNTAIVIIFIFLVVYCYGVYKCLCAMERKAIKINNSIEPDVAGRQKPSK